MDLLRAHLINVPGTAQTNGVLENGQDGGCVSTNGIANDLMLFVHILELDAFHESKLFRCEKYNRIRFLFGASLYERNIILMTNYNDDYTKFDRFVLLVCA